MEPKPSQPTLTQSQHELLIACTSNPQQRGFARQFQDGLDKIKGNKQLTIDLMNDIDQIDSLVEQCREQHKPDQKFVGEFTSAFKKKFKSQLSDIGQIVEY